MDEQFRLMCAAMAMQAIIQASGNPRNPQAVAQQAFDYAEWMMTEERRRRDLQEAAELKRRGI